VLKNAHDVLSRFEMHPGLGLSWEGAASALSLLRSSCSSYNSGNEGSVTSFMGEEGSCA